MKTRKPRKAKTAKKAKATAKLTWLPKKTFEVEFTIAWPRVQKTYQEVLKTIASQTTIKGFRKGKAPLNLVEKSLDKQKLYQQVLDKLLPSTWQNVVKQHRLQPIMPPKITPVNLQEKKDWQFKATSCERPEVKLGDWQKAVKGALAKEKIWVPGKNDKQSDSTKASPDEAKQSYDQKLKIATQTLLQICQVELSDLLLDDEVNRKLSQLLDQVNALGMTIQDYLKTKALTIEQVRVNFRKQAEDTLKLEFILQAIVQARKIKIEKQEIDKMIKANQDEKVRKRLDTPIQRAYLASILAKRKALDFLTSL